MTKVTKIKNVNTGEVLDLIRKGHSGYWVRKPDGTEEFWRFEYAEVGGVETEPTEGKLKLSDIPSIVRKIMPEHQQKVIVGSEEHWGILKNLEERANEVPELYAQNGEGMDAIVYLHYFHGGSDWFITEWDGEDSYFGYAILNQDYEMSELGTMSRTELTGTPPVELDFFWDKKTLQEALEGVDSEYFGAKEEGEPTDEFEGGVSDAGGELWVMTTFAIPGWVWVRTSEPSEEDTTADSGLSSNDFKETYGVAAPSTEGLWRKIEVGPMNGNPESLTEKILPHVEKFVKAKAAGRFNDAAKHERMINKIAGKKVIPAALTDEEMGDPLLLAKIISCVSQVRGTPGVNEFAICRAALEGE